METKELTTHQRGIILRGISGGAALKGKSPHISENNTVITCAGKLNVWDICCISSDAEAFGLKVQCGYDGQTIITLHIRNKWLKLLKPMGRANRCNLPMEPTLSWRKCRQ